MSAYVEKHVDAELDYQFTWSSWLQDGEEIVDFDVEANSDEITISDFYLNDDNNTVVVWVDGGEPRQYYEVYCSITTNSAPVARTDTKTLYITTFPL